MKHFKNFLHNRLEHKGWDSSVYVFVSSQYHPLLAAYLLQGLKKQYSLITFSFNDKTFTDFEVTASTTFLGQTSVIWLGDCSEYDAALKKKLSAFLKTYAGPHVIIAFVNEKEYDEKSPGALVYEKDFDFETVQLFFEYTVGKKLGGESRFIQGYSCEQTITLYLYTLFVNDPQVLIKEGWIEKLCIQETSLFELSKLFFAKKKNAFFELWNRIGQSYAPVFWTMFWSEQLWNAFLVVYLRKNNQFNTAKQVQGRLPFSFLQYDWQHYTPDQLQHAHHEICNIERDIKLSASADSIELFYYTFFQKPTK